MENIMKATEWKALGNYHINIALVENDVDDNMLLSSSEVLEYALNYEGFIGYETMLTDLFKDIYNPVIKFDCMDIRSLCIENDWFTCGSNMQYERMFEMAENGCTLHDLAMVIYTCSDNAEVDEIEREIRDLVF